MEKIEDLKKKGNDAVKSGNYAEAIFHYTHAIKLNDKLHILYSNRSLAFLKLQHYYLALEDAKEAIKLNPEWPKGYFRKAEIEFQAEHFPDAISSYKQALSFDPENPKIMDSIYNAKLELRKQEQYHIRIPWVGSAFGFIAGILMILGYQATYASSLNINPLILLLGIFVCTMIGFLLARIYRYYLIEQGKGHLLPPPNLLDVLDSTKKD